MKKIIALTLSSLLCISAVGCSSKKNNNDIVATVNGNNISLIDFDSRLDVFSDSFEAWYGSSFWDSVVEAGVLYIFKFKDITIDTKSRIVKRNNEEIYLCIYGYCLVGECVSVGCLWLWL